MEEIKNNWNVVSKLPDLLSFRRNGRELNTRIEARKNKDGSWDVFRSYHNDDDFNFVEEFSASSREKAVKLIELLKKEGSPSKKQIEHLKLREHKKVKVELKRCFREIETEKWFFQVDDKGFENFFLLFRLDINYIDVILSDKYKKNEKTIIDQILKVMGLEEGKEEVKIEVFYVSSRRIKNHRRGQIFIDQIEM